MEIYCNEKATMVPQNMETDTSDECVYQVRMEHQSGCAVLNLLPFFRVLGLIFILAGFILTYLGPRATKRFMAFIV